jgi:hypothetical protein
LFAFAAPKHDRLLSFLEERDCEGAAILVIEKQSPRSQLASLVAKLAAQVNPQAEIINATDNEIGTTLRHLMFAYRRWYQIGGANFEIGLTGNKLQTVAAATMSAAVKINQAWYIAPLQFDKTRFTSGAAGTEFYSIELLD